MLKHIFYSVKLLLISLFLSSSINLSAQTRDQLYTIYTSISEQKGEIGASSDEVLWFVADKDYPELEISQKELIIFSKNNDEATMKDITDISDCPWTSCASNITKAKFANKVNSGTKLAYLFKDCSAMTSVDLSNLNTQNNTSFYCTFNGCKSLQSIDLSTINVEKVTSIGSMFSNCESLEELDFSTWKTKKNDLKTFFVNCKNLKKITTGENWNNINIQLPKNSHDWYDENGEIVTAISAGAHVYTCGLISEYYSIYNQIEDETAKGDIGKKSEEVLWFVADKEYTTESGKTILKNELIIFPKYSKESSTMKAINECPWLAKASVITKASFVEPVNSGNGLKELFQNCEKLVSIDFNNNFNTENCKTFYSMFSNCKELLSIDLSQLKVDNLETIRYMFSHCYQITKLDFSSWTTKEFPNDYVFSQCSRLVDIITSENWNITVDNMPTRTDSKTNYTFVDLNSDEKIAQIITPGAHRYVKSDLPCYKIKVSVENPLLGSATAKISDVQFTKALEGDIVNLKAVVNDEQNYKFDKWLIKPSNGESFYHKDNQFTMIADDVEFVAIFKKKYDDITKKRLQLILHYKDLDFDE